MNFTMKCLISAMIRTLVIVKIIMEILWFSTELLWHTGPGKFFLKFKQQFLAQLLKPTHRSSEKKKISKVE